LLYSPYSKIAIVPSFFQLISEFQIF